MLILHLVIVNVAVISKPLLYVHVTTPFFHNKVYQFKIHYFYVFLSPYNLLPSSFHDLFLSNIILDDERGVYYSRLNKY